MVLTTKPSAVNIIQTRSRSTETTSPGTTASTSESSAPVAVSQSTSSPPTVSCAHRENVMAASIRLESFSGESDIDQFLRRFDQYCVCLNLKSEQALAQLSWHLDGMARLYIESLPSIPTSVDALKTVLTDKFRKTKPVNLQIFSMRQDSSENAEQFLSRLEVETFKTKISEEFQVQIALNGLHPTVSSAISTHAPKTLNEVRQLASRLTNVQYAAPVAAAAPSHLDTTMSVLTKAVAQLTSILQDQGQRQTEAQACRRCGDAQFKSQLDDASKKKAKDELFERNDKDRDSAVQNLRKWVLEQSDWLKSPTDYAFLLRFLRVRKFSQLEARTTIERYWAIKDDWKTVFRDMETTDPIFLDILKNGMYLVPKQRDKDGCRLMITRPGNVSVEKIKKDWGIENLYKSIFVMMEWLMMDENSQVNGIKFVWEYTNLTMGFVTLLTGFQNNQTAMKFQDKCMPARTKGMYLYNEPVFIEALLILFTPFMSKKIKDRIKAFGQNLPELYENVGTSVLPDEYLPDDHAGASAGPQKQIIEDMIADLTSPKTRDYLKEISSTKYYADLKKKPQEDEVASFRKLNVD